MAEVLMGFGHEPIWGVRGSPIDINYSMSKTFTPIPRGMGIEIVILFSDLHLLPIFHCRKHLCEHGTYMQWSHALCFFNHQPQQLFLSLKSAHYYQEYHNHSYFILNSINIIAIIDTKWSKLLFLSLNRREPFMNEFSTPQMAIWKVPIDLSQFEVIKRRQGKAMPTERPPCSRGDPKPHLMGGCKGGLGDGGKP